MALGIRSFVISGIMLGWLILNKDINPVAAVGMTSLALIVLEGICTALIGQLFYYYTLKSGDASTIVSIIALFPLFTFIIATLFLGDKVTLIKVDRIASIVLGVVLLRL